MRTPRNPRLYLEDILGAIEAIMEYTKEGARAFFADSKTQDAVLRQLSIIGEAAAKLPQSLRDSHRDIPWQEMIGMRNVVIHDYTDIKIERIWETVKEDLPALRKKIRALRKAKKA